MPEKREHSLLKSERTSEGETPPAKPSPSALAGDGTRLQYEAQVFLYRAVKTLQAENLGALKLGESRGLAGLDMAIILDRELAYSDLYAALALYVEHYGDPLKVARAALAKARGESPDAG